MTDIPLLRPVVLGAAAAGLDPVGQAADGGGQSEGGVVSRVQVLNGVDGLRANGK